MRKQIEVLEDHADVLPQPVYVGGRGMNGRVIDEDLAFLNRLQAIDRANERGFAATARSRDDNDSSGGHVKRHVIQDVKLPVPLVDALGGNHSVLRYAAQLT